MQNIAMNDVHTCLYLSSRLHKCFRFVYVEVFSLSTFKNEMCSDFYLQNDDCIFVAITLSLQTN